MEKEKKCLLLDNGDLAQELFNLLDGAERADAVICYHIEALKEAVCFILYNRDELRPKEQDAVPLICEKLSFIVRDLKDIKNSCVNGIDPTSDDKKHADFGDMTSDEVEAWEKQLNGIVFFDNDKGIGFQKCEGKTSEGLPAGSALVITIDGMEFPILLGYENQIDRLKLYLNENF